MIQRFEVELLEQAYEFLRKLDLKHRKKIIQNMDRAKFHTDPKLFKKLDGEIWESELYSRESNIVCSPSGIRPNKLRRWFSQLMDSSRKQVRLTKRKLLKLNELDSNTLKVRSHETIHT